MSLSGVLPVVQRRREFSVIGEALDAGRRPWVTGPVGAGKACLLAGLIVRAGARVPAWLVVAPDRDHAERLADDLAMFLPDAHPATPGDAAGGVMTATPQTRPAVHLLELWDPPVPGEPLSLDAERTRQNLLEALRRAEPVVAVASAAGLVVPLPDAGWLEEVRVEFRQGAPLRLEDVTARLSTAGYERVELVHVPGEMSVRGGIIDVYPPTSDHPVRAEWAGDEIESVRLFDPETQRTTAAIEAATILPARADFAGPGASAGTLLPALLPEHAVCVLDEPDEVGRQAAALVKQAEAARAHAVATGQVPEGTPAAAVPWDRIAAAVGTRRTAAISTLRTPPNGTGYAAVQMEFGTVESFAGQVEGFAEQARRWIADRRRIVVASRQAQRIRELLGEHGVAAAEPGALAAPPEPGVVAIVDRPLTQGFALGELVVVTDSEILGWRRRRGRPRWFRDGARLASWTELVPGDLVVHVHHGIGVYRGLERLSVDGAARDYLRLEYAQGDALYVPTDQIALVQRYVGVDGDAPQIHRLGGTEWEREKRRVRERTREMARELLDLYAARERARGHAFGSDTPWQREMEEAFVYEETPDQRKAIDDVKRDMEAGRPMDRLVAGDVGYGKTEVALRAAFKAVTDGRQVAVLVPTTLLAQQHYTVFRERFAPFPIRVELLSRFRSPAERRVVLEGLRDGTIDVVIGTHALLNKNLTFRALGLVVVDEEQRFGVRHKERLKQLRTQVDVLTLTATPIPRTLHMSLAGLRDLSVMETPPEARQPIRTFIHEDDPALIAGAIRRELARDGQVYVVHNRVETIDRAAERIRRLVPEARVVVAHGQMPEAQLERIMLEFLGGRADVLVCTTIVEIGLDIPRVNTIFVENAHLLGLAQLYQLRGRVGRADRQAYAYLLHPRDARLTPEAEQRLVAMREFVELGSGLRLAMRDLEIRGAGNLLGAEQHGHLAAVGFDLYMRLLDEAIRELRGEIVDDAPDPTVDLGVGAYLPESYVEAPAQRVAAYRRLAETRTPEDAAAAIAELRDRYGPLPEPVQRLADVIRLRALARSAGVTAIARGEAGVLVRLSSPASAGPRVHARIAQSRGRLRWTAEGILIPTAGMETDEIVRTVERLLEWLAAEARREPQAAPAAEDAAGGADGPEAGPPGRRLTRAPHRAAVR
ncbi:MAG TPA: transcription-repair coupling factor [bacterium]|nr:transcription-repair coupling factor [bacterium]